MVAVRKPARTYDLVKAGKAFGCVECKVRSITEPGERARVIGEVVQGGVHARGDSLTCADLPWHSGG